MRLRKGFKWTKCKGKIIIYFASQCDKKEMQKEKLIFKRYIGLITKKDPNNYKNNRLSNSKYWK